MKFWLISWSTQLNESKQNSLFRSEKYFIFRIPCGVPIKIEGLVLTSLSHSIGGDHWSSAKSFSNSLAP